MSVTSTSGAAALKTLADTLVATFDRDKNGALSANEFLDLLKCLAGQHPAATDTGKTAAATPADMKFEGFNFTREQDPAKSAKDAFAMLAKKNGPMPMTKADAESWFNTRIKPEFEGMGHKVNWVQGDKFQFTNWQGTYTVDFVRGADGSNPALAWQTE